MDKQNWFPIGIKGKYTSYEIMENSDDVLCLYYNGKMLPKQISLTIEQELDGPIFATVKFLII